MIKYTKAECRELVTLLSANAKAAGLLEENERLQFEAGNTSYGITAVVRRQRLDEDGNWRNALRPSWVPEFGYKDGPSFIGNVLVAVNNTVEATVNGWKHTQYQQ